MATSAPSRPRRSVSAGAKREARTAPTAWQASRAPNPNGPRPSTFPLCTTRTASIALPARLIRQDTRARLRSRWCENSHFAPASISDITPVLSGLRSTGRVRLILLIRTAEHRKVAASTPKGRAVATPNISAPTSGPMKPVPASCAAMMRALAVERPARGVMKGTSTWAALRQSTSPVPSRNMQT